ncbi:phosphoribosylglycinamide formyltransferase 1 [Gammaproteobacteria bacterium]|nr:phosphoribosylglycinamide formyltransferase 1 [Gammaproteobacteria bacterium]
MSSIPILTKKKIAVLISGRGSNLQALYHYIKHYQLAVEISLVISNKEDAAGLIFCKEHNIPNQVIVSKGKTKAEFDQQLLETLQTLKLDLIILAGFMRILSLDLINIFVDKIINIHPSLLPKYKGLDTQQRALDAHDTKIGASVHVVTESLDSGLIIAQIELGIYPDDNAKSLTIRLLPAEHQLYCYIIGLWARDVLSFSDNIICLYDQALNMPLQLKYVD